ncbi:MAG TPA: long-chain acyl-CoA synthetase, partial [Rhodobacteraceae bacterium]|nr:long-chain acyl-CoA synthetase [Paracoccaceae bacterium]
MSAVIRHIRKLAATDRWRPALSAPAQQLGYGELWQAVRELAATLAAAGDRTIAMDIANPFTWMMADLALVLKRNVTVPLPPFFTAAQKEHAIHSSGAGWVLTDAPDAADAAGKQAVSCARGLFLCPVSARRVVHHHGTAKITYTSGTTGDPKGV